MGFRFLNQLIDFYRLISIIFHFLHQSLPLTPLRAPNIAVAESPEILNVFVQRLDILNLLVVLLFVELELVLLRDHTILRN